MTARGGACRGLWWRSPMAHMRVERGIGIHASEHREVGENIGIACADAQIRREPEDDRPG